MFLSRFQGGGIARGDSAGTGPRGGASEREGPQRANIQGASRRDRAGAGAGGERQKGEGPQPSDPGRMGSGEGDEAEGEAVAVRAAEGVMTVNQALWGRGKARSSRNSCGEGSGKPWPCGCEFSLCGGTLSRRRRTYCCSNRAADCDHVQNNYKLVRVGTLQKQEFWLCDCFGNWVRSSWEGDEAGREACAGKGRGN
jgi:hypothetical protein